MNALGALLEEKQDVILERWLARLPVAPAELPRRELQDHVPLFVRELAAALHAGHTPTSSAAAREHGQQREELGFDVDVVVREWGVLLDVVLDLAGEEGIAVSIAETRNVTGLVALGVGESVAAHRRNQERLSRRQRDITTAEQGRADRASARLVSKEAELETVLDAIPLLVAFVDADERYGLVNKAYESWFGTRTDELRGRRVADVIGPAAYAVLGPYVKRALAGERFRFEKHAVPYRVGGTRDVAVQFLPQFDGAGNVTGYVSLLEDITVQRRTETERDALLGAEREAQREALLQRQRIQTLLATAPIGIATWRGPEHVFDSANDIYLGILQRGRDVIGKPIRTAFAEVPADHPIFAVWDAVYRTGITHVDHEYRITLQLDGRPTEKVFLFHLAATRDPEGEIDGTMASFTDVTDVVRLRELIEVERDLANVVAELETTARHSSEESHARTQFLLDVAGALGESLDVSVVLQRLAGAVAPAHALIAGVWARTPEGALRRFAHAPATPALEGNAPLSSEAAGGVAIPVEQVMASGETLQVDDYQAWMTAAGAPAVGGQGRAIGLGPALYVPLRRGAETVGVLTVGRRVGGSFAEEDVVVFESVARIGALSLENARLYGEMANLRQAAENATVAKDHFLANVSHDLRNPLSSILGWAAMLRDLPDAPPQMRRGVEVIERNAKAQVQLIEDLLDVTRIASGKLTLALVVEDVRGALDAALDSARLAAAAKKVRLVLHAEDEIGAIAVDPDRFRQIVWNLASNAVKFTPPGGTVRISAQRTGPVLRLVVEDDGQGIPEGFLSRVFGTFEQVASGGHRAGGLGLGLAIAKKLVELHRGTIRVESEGEGKGTRFTIELPIRAAVHVADGAPDATSPLGGLQLLVVDDEEEARDVISTILEHAGARVTGASSVDDALDVVRGALPDAVVSDIAMPGRDGKELVRAIRALPRGHGSTLPVVALTAFVSRRERQEILGAGFDAHVAKPVEAAELVARIAELVGRSVS